METIEMLARSVVRWTGDLVEASIKGRVERDVIPNRWYLTLDTIELDAVGKSIHNYTLRRYDADADVVRQVFHAIGARYPVERISLDFIYDSNEPRPVILFSLVQQADFPPGFETPLVPTESITIRYEEYGFQTVVTESGAMDEPL